MGDWRRTSSVTSMLSVLGWETLEERRARMRISMLFNIIQGSVAVDGQSFLEPLSYCSTRGASKKFKVPMCRTSVYMASFFPDAVKRWNRLPCHVTEAPSIESLKIRLKEVKLT